MVLDGDDRSYGARSRKLSCGHVRHTDMADFAFPLKVDKSADGLLDRYPMVNCMQLVKLDTLDLQPFQAFRTGTAQMLGSTVGDPMVGPGAQKPALGGHHQPRGIGIECLRDQSFTDLGAVRVGGVDKGDALLDRALQQRYCLRLIPRRAPDARAGNAHCAKTNLSDGQLGEVCLRWHVPPTLPNFDLWALRPQVVSHEIRLPNLLVLQKRDSAECEGFGVLSFATKDVGDERRKVRGVAGP